jgi:glycogen synthase
MQAMAQDWGWSKAAGQYVEIYQDSLDARRCKRELH